MCNAKRRRPTLLSKCRDAVPAAAVAALKESSSSLTTAVVVSKPAHQAQDLPGYLKREYNQVLPEVQSKAAQDVVGISSSSCRHQEHFNAAAASSCSPQEHQSSNNNNTTIKMQNALSELYATIAERPQGSRQGFDTAVALSSAHVEHMLATFLVAEDFQIPLAARRATSHFQTKQELFGKDKLTRTIGLKDLTMEDLQILESGAIQLLPSRDRGGRQVLVRQHSKLRYKTRNNVVSLLYLIDIFLKVWGYKNYTKVKYQTKSKLIANAFALLFQLRALWYMVHCQENQEGIVLVDYDVDQRPGVDCFDDSFACDDFDILSSDFKGGFDMELSHQMLKMMRSSLATRMVAIHLCFEHEQWERIHDTTAVLLGKAMRLRMKRHEGSQKECFYNLLCHGIPSNEIEVGTEGELLRNSHTQWIRNRVALESVPCPAA
jgi:hypothetical protein